MFRSLDRTLLAPTLALSLTVLSSLGGCTRAQTASPTVVKPPPSSSSSPLSRVADLPARYTQVGWFAERRAPIIVWAQSWPGAPPCIDATTAGLTGMLQLSDGAGDTGMVFHGSFGRDAVEACLVQAGHSMGIPATTRRLGSLTEVAPADGAPFYLAWYIDRMAYHTDPERARDLANPTARGEPHPTLVTLARRVDPATAAWVLAAGDYTTAILQVPSLGIYLATDLAGLANGASSPTSGPMPLTIAFESSEHAARAVAASGQWARDSRLSNGLRECLERLDFRAAGSSATLDLMPLVQCEGGIQELLLLVQGATGSPAAPAAERSQ